MSIDTLSAKRRFLDLMQCVASTDMPVFTIWLDFKIAEYKCKLQGDLSLEDSVTMTYPKWISDSLQQQLASLLISQSSTVDSRSQKRSFDDSSFSPEPVRKANRTFSPSEDNFADDSYVKEYKERHDSLDSASFKKESIVSEVIEIKEESDGYEQSTFDDNCSSDFTNVFPGNVYSLPDNISQSYCLSGLTSTSLTYGQSNLQSLNSTLDNSVSRKVSSGNRRFKCPECDTTFAASADLKRHLPDAHGHEGVELIEETPMADGHRRSWRCCYCQKRTLDISNAWNHLFSVHCNAIFFCDSCGKGFKFLCNLSKHRVVCKTAAHEHQ